MVLLFTIMVGIGAGSFANVLIDRVPRGQSIGGRSQCDRCRRRLAWWELVPVFSAIMLRYRCRTCGGDIAWRMTVIEVGTAILFVLVLLSHGGVVTPIGVLESGALFALGVLAVIDAQRGVVPDALSVPAIVLIALGSFAVVKSGTVVLSMLLGAAFFWLQRIVSRGRWVGDGDTRVGALMGALFPSAKLAVAIGSGYIVGGVFAAILLLARRVERGAHIPLVPFLFIGAVIAVVSGEAVLRLYGW